mmetsp:Transcript_28579/g.76925  ORF Transcript_28579/g.76925 Transcript_28579/m.76925 type:complete len:292 (+) Transcript_28579:91-966(+)
MSKLPSASPASSSPSSPSSNVPSLTWESIRADLAAEPMSLPLGPGYDEPRRIPPEGVMPGGVTPPGNGGGTTPAERALGISKDERASGNSNDERALLIPGPIWSIPPPIRIADAVLSALICCMTDWRRLDSLEPIPCCPAIVTVLGSEICDGMASCAMPSTLPGRLLMVDGRFLTPSLTSLKVSFTSCVVYSGISRSPPSLNLFVIWYSGSLTVIILPRFFAFFARLPAPLGDTPPPPNPPRSSMSPISKPSISSASPADSERRLLAVISSWPELFRRLSSWLPNPVLMVR